MGRLGRAQPKRAFITRGVVEVGEPVPQTIVKSTAQVPPQRQILPAITSRAPAGPPGAGSVNLTPADTALIGVTLTATPGVVTVNLTPADTALVGVALTATPGVVTTNLTPAGFSLDGIALSPLGSGAVILTPADLPLVGVALAPVGVGLAGRSPVVPSVPATVQQRQPHPVVLTRTAFPPQPPAQPIVVDVAYETAVRRRSEQLLPVIDLGPPVLAPAGTVNLTPADLPLIGVTLTATPGVVTVNLTPASVSLTGITVAPTPGVVTVNLTPATLPLVGVTLTATPGLITVNLAPASFSLDGIATSPVGVAAPIPQVTVHGFVDTPQRRRLVPPSITRTPTIAPPGTVALNPAELNLAGVPLAPLGVAIIPRTTVALTAHEAAYRRRIEQAPGPTILRAPPAPPSTTTLTPALVDLAGIALTPTPGVVTVNLSPATLPFVGVAVVPSVPVLTVNLTPASLALTGRTLNPIQGNGNPTLTPAGLALTAQSLVSTPGPVSTTLTRASFALTGVPLAPRPMVQLTPAGLTFTGRPVDPQPGAPTVPLGPALLILDASPLLPLPGGTAILLTPASFALVAVTIHIGPLPKVPYSRLRPLQPQSTDLRPLQPPAHRRFPQ